MKFGDKIIALRNERKMSQGDLAEKLGVSRQSVSKWETGQSIPEIDKISAMSDLFGVTTDYLIISGISQSSAIPNTVNVNQKVMILDANMRKLASFEEFSIEIIAFSSKNQTEHIPVCVLNGIKRGLLGIKRRVVLGYYATLQDAQQELKNIRETCGRSTTYQLKYAAKMNGVHITDYSDD